MNNYNNIGGVITCLVISVATVFVVVKNQKHAIGHQNVAPVMYAPALDTPCIIDDNATVIPGLKPPACLIVHRKSITRPVLPKCKTDKDRADSAYVMRFYVVACTEQRKYGIPASIAMAQGILESKSGGSYLAKKANNHFGIKCFSRKCKRGHCLNKEDDSHKDFFVNYATAWYSWRAHSEFLQKDRYSELKGFGLDYKKWAKGLKRCGYATDPRYDKTLISIIERMKLYQLDTIKV